MFKKYSVLVLFLVLIVGGYNVIYASTSLYGDLNGDGRINSADVTLLNRHIMEAKILDDITLADLNGDGQVNTIDFSLLNRYLLEMIDSFPVGKTVNNPIPSDEGQINLATNITYSGTGISVNGSIVTISEGGEYKIDGTLTNGMLHVDTSQEVTLRLNGVNIANSNGPAIYVENAKKVNIILENGTINSLNDGNISIYDTDDEKVKGVISSNVTLEIDGNGTLNVRGNYQHGIISYGDLNIKNGNIYIQSAVTDGIHAKNYLEITGGNIEINADSDGIDSKGDIYLNGGVVKISAAKHGIKLNENIAIDNGNFEINAQRDGINTEGNMRINGGKLVIKTAEEGLDITGELNIGGGEINIECPEDGMDIKGDLKIEAGTINVNSATKDAIDSSSSILITGGVFDLRASKDGIKADYDITIEDGLFYIYADSDGIEADRGLVIFDGEFNIFAKDDALHATSNLVIHNGTFNIKDAYEGIESGDEAVIIHGGEFLIEASDDGINAQKDITINGGNIHITVQNGDGIDSNGTIHINGGYIFISAAGQPEGSIDNDGATFAITGGTIIGMAGNVAEITRDATTQPVLVLGGAQANSVITIRSNDNTEVANFTVPRKFDTLIFTSPDLKLNTTYTMYVNGNQQRTFTTSSIVTVDGGMEFNPFGGWGGGGFPGWGGDWGGGFPGWDFGNDGW